MVSLTSELPEDTRGKAIIAPAAPAPSIFGSLAQTAGNLVPGWAENQQKGIQLGNLKAANELAGGVFKIQQGAEEQSTGAAQTEMLNQINMGTNDVNKVKQAAQQGRIPQAAVDAQVESLVSGLMSKYPDQRSFLADQLQSKGIDHYLFRDQKLQEAQGEQDAKDNMAIRHDYILQAKTAGLAMPGMSDDDLMAAGQKLSAAQYSYNQSKQMADLAKTYAETDKMRYDQVTALSKRADTQGAIAEMEANFGALKTTLGGLFTQAGDDPDKLAQLDKVLPEIEQAAQTRYSHWKQTYSANGGDPEVVKTMDDQYKNNVDAIHSLYAGETTQRKLNQAAYQDFQARLGLDTGRALPLWAGITKIIPPQLMANLFNGDPSLGLSKEFLGNLMGELKGYDPLHPNKSIAMLYQAKEIMAGRTSLNDMKESDISPDMLRTLNAGASGMSKDILLNPVKAPDDTKSTFLHSLGNLSLMASKLQPGYKNLDGLNWITGAVQKQDNVSALVQLTSDPKFGDQAKDTMMITRAGAAQALEVVKSYSNQLEFTNGVFKPKQNAQPEIASYAGQTPLDKNGNAITPAQHDPAIQRQADIANASLTYLTRTAQFDDQVPKGTKYSELVSHYALGTPLETDAAKSKTKTTDQFSANVAKFEASLANDSASVTKNQPYVTPTQAEAVKNQKIYGPQVTAAAQKYGLNPKFMSTLVANESSWDPNADAHLHHPESHAGGLMQIQPGTMEMMGYKGEDRFDPAKNIDSGMKYFKQLLDKHNGDYKAAARDYSGNTYKPHVMAALASTLGE